MIKELIVNGSLIIAFLFLGGNIFKNEPFNLSSSKKIKVLGGCSGGILGSILMLYSINITDTFIIDMRNIALIIVTLLGGWISAIICALLIGISRIIFFGINQASLVACIVQIVQVIAFLFVLKVNRWSFKLKFWIMNLISILIVLFAFGILLKMEQLLMVTISYIFVFLSISFYSFYTLIYIKKSNQLFRKLKTEAKIDFLTGLHNVRQFDEYYNLQLKIAKENKEKLSVLVIDIDHFKKVNDTYGHVNGDLVIQKLGSILKDTTRQFDFVARKGGDEVVILLLDCSHQRALEVTERICSTVEKTLFPISDDREISITISIGVSTFPDTTDDTDELLKQADSELYRAKRDGRNRVSSILKVDTSL